MVCISVNKAIAELRILKLCGSKFIKGTNFVRGYLIQLRAAYLAKDFD